MNSLTEIWNVLHDGKLVEIIGAVPGDVQLKIEIPYLRDFFQPAGISLRVTLGNCTLLRMVRRSSGIEPIILEDQISIAALKCWILSTESETCPAKISTTEGELELNYSSQCLSLDTGQSISHEEICKACELYWKKFGERQN